MGLKQLWSMRRFEEPHNRVRSSEVPPNRYTMLNWLKRKFGCFKKKRDLFDELMQGMEQLKTDREKKQDGE